MFDPNVRKEQWMDITHSFDFQNFHKVRCTREMYQV